MKRLVFAGAFPALTLAVALAACAASSGAPDVDSSSGGQGGDGGDGPAGSGGSAGAGGAPDDGGLGLDGLAEGGPIVGEVYAHDPSTLYLLDPISKAVSVVGAFDCVGPADPLEGNGYDAMHDIAIDKDGKMMGVGLTPDKQQGLFTIDPASAKCSLVAPMAVDMRGLTFVPAGVIEPASEVLVGLSVSGELARIDPVTGAVTPIGPVSGVGNIVAKGGDIVSIKDDRTYAMAYTQADCCNDHTLVVDPNTAMVVEDLGNSGIIKLGGGLGYWGGTLYAFGFNGKLYAVDTKTGLPSEIPVPNPPASFRGAAVTTIAPVDPPK